jgi:LmbE family N-acetylglucosaminyl deacetylase
MARIIVFGPHPDDQEIGMGASIAKLADQGHDVLIVDVTDGSPTPRGDRASRLLETQAALAALQPEPQRVASGEAKPIRRVLLDLPNRMVEHTIATRHQFAGAIRAWQASIVFTPWPEDAHPDHRAVTRSVEDARFDAKLTKVEMPLAPGFSKPEAGGITTLGAPTYPKWLIYYHVSHLRAPVVPSFCLDVTGYEQKKLVAVKAYRSQFGPWDEGAGAAGSSHGPGSTGVPPVSSASFAEGDPKRPAYDAMRGRLVTPDFPERMLAFSAYMGMLIGTAHAEPFMMKEPVGLGSLALI